MAHMVQLVIGRKYEITRFVDAWPQTCAVMLEGEWAAAPLTDKLSTALSETFPGGHKDPAFDEAPAGLFEALSAATREGGALAYVETEYFGGQGSQSAGVFAKGQARDCSRGTNAINDALRFIGVDATGSKDAFDVVGLGKRRWTKDYETECGW